MKKNTLIALAVVIVLLLVGAWWAFSRQGDEERDSGDRLEELREELEEEQEEEAEESVGQPSEPEQKVVTYTDSGFSPSTLTVEAGDTVVFRNESSGAFWPASAVHPTHLLYPEFDAKASISLGGTYSFTFNRVGTWKYHNHLNASQTGTLVVE